VTRRAIRRPGERRLSWCFRRRGPGSLWKQPQAAAGGTDRGPSWLDSGPLHGSFHLGGEEPQTVLGVARASRSPVLPTGTSIQEVGWRSSLGCSRGGDGLAGGVACMSRAGGCTRRDRCPTGLQPRASGPFVEGVGPAWAAEGIHLATSESQSRRASAFVIVSSRRFPPQPRELVSDPALDGVRAPRCARGEGARLVAGAD